MQQLTLLNDTPIIKPVNVSSVPKRSPFRYAGGKTWFVPYIRKWLSRYDSEKIEFFEPFAGGAIVGLTVAFENLAKHSTLIELDKDVVAVWQTIISDHYEWLSNKILHFEMNEEAVEKELSAIPKSTKEIAFQTILKNRVNHGGILAAGAGRLKHGEKGKGLLSRWYPKTLYNRIQEINNIRDKISCFNGDGLEFIKAHSQQKNNLFFIDPPYTAGGKKAGKRLYTHSQIDHELLFSLVNEIQGDFLMTYDIADEVYDLAKKHNFDTQLIAMKNTHHAQMTELLIGRDLNWIRSENLPGA
jgi:DNA adenine methylase